MIIISDLIGKRIDNDADEGIALSLKTSLDIIQAKTYRIKNITIG